MSGNRRGFSIWELAVTVLVLALLALLLLKILQKRTILEEGGGSRGGVEGALGSAVYSLTRDLRAAGAGTGPFGPPVLPAEDNTPEGRAHLDAKGARVDVRAGSDQIRIRGIIGTRPVSLDEADRTTGEGFSDLFQRSPRNAALKIYVYPLRENPRRIWISNDRANGGLGEAWRSGAKNELAGELLARLRTARAPGRASVFFAVADAASNVAVARVLSVDESALATGCSCTAPAPLSGDCPPGRAGCFLVLHLDFTDPDAGRLDPLGDPEAYRELGAVVSGGLLDDLLYFVARGDPAPTSSQEPLSMRYPHPYLVAARSIGGGRYEMVRVADDIEDLQVAYGIPDAGRRPASDASAAVTRLVFQPVAPDERPPEPSAFVDAFGRVRLKMVKIALVARDPSRGPGSPGGPFAEIGGSRFEGLRLLNAPGPGDAAFGSGPIGWSPRSDRCVGSRRRALVFDVGLRNGGQGSGG